MGNKRRASVAEPSDANDVEVHKVAKKSRPNASLVSPTGKDGEGNPLWQLSSKRHVGVSKFNNAIMVSIREHYEKDDKLLPTKKGISLSVEQYTALIKVMPSINEKLRKMGQLVDATGGAVEAIVKKPKKERSDKANIEATSDEDEDEDED